MRLDLKHYWAKVYYPVKDFLFPWNVIKLKKLDRSYQEVDTLMEEAVLQLLDDFFQKEQPLHQAAGVSLEKGFISISRHAELLERVYGAGHRASSEEVRLCYATKRYALMMYPIYKQLLDTLDWYRNGGLNKENRGPDLYMSVHKNTGSCEEATNRERDCEQLISQRLMFIMENRKHLWT